jgi:hypothetical protein
MLLINKATAKVELLYHRTLDVTPPTFLRPLVYSTCSVNPIENEAVIGQLSACAMCKGECVMGGEGLVIQLSACARVRGEGPCYTALSLCKGECVVGGEGLVIQLSACAEVKGLVIQPSACAKVSVLWWVRGESSQPVQG